MSSEPTVASKISHESLEKYVEEISNLPKAQGWRPLRDLCLYQNFWFFPFFLQGALHARDHFRPRPTDIFLCSSMKTGSTWLKALSFTIVTRGSHRLDGSDPTIPLRTTVPHDCIPFLEFNEYSTTTTTTTTTTTVAAEGSKIQLYASHLPYTCLPKSIHDSNCRIVYICRDPKDTFVSMWFFLEKFVSNQTKTDTVSLVPIEEAFDLFCKGMSSHGPYWDHVLSYWEASKRSPENILIIKYEDMVEYIKIKKVNNVLMFAHPGNRTPVSTVGGYYDTTTLDALLVI
ncbi:hypothetical protein GQ457_12G005530 [Hibiscus cannabinus]